jgi:tRNA uridine 5-carboxymethylaminomethyl modification enzyme
LRKCLATLQWEELQRANCAWDWCLGGYLGIVSDKLHPVQDAEQINGPAMWFHVFKVTVCVFEEWRMMLKGPKSWFYQEMVSGLIIENGVVKGIKLLRSWDRSKSVLTNGTFWMVWFILVKTIWRR